MRPNAQARGTREVGRAACDGNVGSASENSHRGDCGTCHRPVAPEQDEERWSTASAVLLDLRASQPSRYSHCGAWGGAPTGRVRLSGSGTGTRARGLHLIISVELSDNPSLWLGNLETSLLAVDVQNRCRMGETGIQVLPSRPHPVSHVLFLHLCSWETQNYSRMPAIRQVSFIAPKSEVEGSYMPLRCLLLRRGMVGFGEEKWGQTKAWGSVHFLYIQTANQI